MANKRTFTLLFLAAITSINPYLGPAFAEESQWNGFVNYTRWVDKNNDNNVAEDELLNINEFVLNDLGNFSFIVFQQGWNKFYTPEEGKAQYSFEIYAKDNDSGKEWKVYESTFAHGNINFFQLLPIAGDITLTCTYSNLARKPSLTYEFISKNKEQDQHLNYYLNDGQILALSKLNEEKVNAFRSSKSVGLKVIQNYDWITAYELPFYETANRLLKFTGININDNQNITNDLQIIVNVNGTSEPGTSRFQTSVGGYKTVDTRVSVGFNGTFIFKSALKDYYANNFDWKKRINPIDIVWKLGRGSQRTGLIVSAYQSMFYNESFLKVFGEMLIGAFELNPVDFYLYAATDESEAISYNALRLLGELHDKTAFAPLLEIYSNDKSTWKRRGAIYALGEMQDARAFDTVIEALNEKDSKIRSNAGETLFSTLLEMQDPRAFDIMLEALNSTYSYIRGLAANALGDLNDSRTVGVLINALEDKDHIVVINVVNALGNSRDKHVIEPLIININRAENNKDWRKWQRNNVINATIKVLGGFRDPVTIEYIIPLMKKRAFREEAQKALTQLAGEDLGKKYKAWRNWWNEHKEGYE